MERGIKARVYPATIDGTASGEPVLMSRETLAKKRVEMAGTFNSQMLQNPSPDEDAYSRKSGSAGTTRRQRISPSMAPLTSR